MSTSKIDQRLQKIHSLFRRRDFKKAYKEAVFVAKQTDTPEAHALKITSLWEWIKEQYQRNQFADAKANIQELLRLPGLPVAVQAEFPPIFRALGLNSHLPEELRQDTSSTEIQIELVDHYLLTDNKTGDLLPETLHDADRVRMAFGKIEAEQDESALELLQPISYRSPLADWRLFLRGLVDHYHGEVEKADASWKRLSPNRPSARIAARLKNLMLEKTVPSTVPSGGFISGLLNLFRGKKNAEVSQKAMLLDTLRILDEYMKQGKDKELMGRFQSIKSVFQKEMPIQYARLFQVIHHHIVRTASPSTVQQFIDRNLPLPLDPVGNRSKAYLVERIDRDSRIRRPAGLADPPVYWKKFVEEDIDRIESFSPQMKARAKASVYDYMAMQAHNEFCDARDEMEDDEECRRMYDVPLLVKITEEMLESAITSDPTYLKAYSHLANIYLDLLPPEEQKNPFHSRLVEIYERQIRHVPGSQEALSYLFEYHLNSKDMVAAGSYHDRLRELDPLSRETLFRRNRLLIGQMREGLRQRNFDQFTAAFHEFDRGPTLESLQYRLDVIPLALGYIHQVLCGDTADLSLFFPIAERLGVEKRLPLIFMIITEGQELGLSENHLASLRSEWCQGISGRCHGNTAGVLGDLACMILSVQERYPKAVKELVRDACAFVNRSGQVKWNSEKDLFGACSLLWYLSVDRQWEGYDKNYRILVKKWLKMFPHSPWPLFFSAETWWLETNWNRYRMANKTRELYQEFLKRAGSMQNDPVYRVFIAQAESKMTKIDEPYWGFGGGGGFDDEYDDDDDEFDFAPPTGRPSGFNVTSDVQHKIKALGGIPAELRREMEKALPRSMGTLGKIYLDIVEECLVKNIPEDQWDEVFERKMENLSFFEKMKIMASMTMNGLPFGGSDDEEDDRPTRSSRSKKRKK